MINITKEKLILPMKSLILRIADTLIKFPILRSLPFPYKKEAIDFNKFLELKPFVNKENN